MRYGATIQNRVFQTFFPSRLVIVSYNDNTSRHTFDTHGLINNQHPRIGKQNTRTRKSSIFHRTHYTRYHDTPTRPRQILGDTTSWFRTRRSPRVVFKRFRRFRERFQGFSHFWRRQTCTIINSRLFAIFLKRNIRVSGFEKSSCWTETRVADKSLAEPPVFGSDDVPKSLCTHNWPSRRYLVRKTRRRTTDSRHHSVSRVVFSFRFVETISKVTWKKLLTGEK